MSIPIAEILRPGRGILRGVHTPFGIMQDYIDIMAEARYSRRKKNRGFLEMLLRTGDIKKQNQSLLKECYLSACQQKEYLLKFSGLEVLLRQEYDELAIPEQNWDSAEPALGDFIMKMNRLLENNETNTFFAVNSYIDGYKRVLKGESPYFLIPEDVMKLPFYEEMRKGVNETTRK